MKHLLLLLYAFFFLLAVPTAEASALSLKVSPLRIQINTNTNKNIQKQISIVNTSDIATTLDIFIQPFTASSRNDGTLTYKSTDATKDTNTFLEKNVRLLLEDRYINSLSLAPQQEKKVILEVNIPDDQKYSDYYFSVLFVSQVASLSAQIESPLTIQSNAHAIASHSLGIATNIIVSINPQHTPPQAQIEDFSTDLFRLSGPTFFTLKVKNTGDHVIAPKGILVVKNMFNQPIGQLEIEQASVLAHTSRYLQTNSHDALALPQIVWPEKFLLGPYRATLSLALSDKGPQLTETIIFYAFPLQGFAVISIVVLILALIIKRIRKNISSSI